MAESLIRRKFKIKLHLGESQVGWTNLVSNTLYRYYNFSMEVFGVDAVIEQVEILSKELVHWRFPHALAQELGALLFHWKRHEGLDPGTLNYEPNQLNDPYDLEIVELSPVYTDDELTVKFSVDIGDTQFSLQDDLIHVVPKVHAFFKALYPAHHEPIIRSFNRWLSEVPCTVGVTTQKQIHSLGLHKVNCTLTTIKPT